MDSILDFLTQVEDTTTVFSAADVIFVIVLSFLTAILIGYTYQATYVGTSYAQTYVQTLVILTMVVGIIMLVIGSNIARAFSLVGALSVVRFRNAVKDTRDVGYVFFAMAIGMAVGTRFYLLAIVAAVSICFVIWYMFKMDMFANRSRSNILRVRLATDIEPDDALNEIFKRYLSRYHLIATESVQGGFLNEHVFEIDFNNEEDTNEFLNAMRKATDNNKVVIIRGYHEVNL